MGDVTALIAADRGRATCCVCAPLVLLSVCGSVCTSARLWSAGWLVGCLTAPFSLSLVSPLKSLSRPHTHASCARTQLRLQRTQAVSRAGRQCNCVAAATNDCLPSSTSLAVCVAHSLAACSSISLSMLAQKLRYARIFYIHAPVHNAPTALRAVSVHRQCAPQVTRCNGLAAIVQAAMNGYKHMGREACSCRPRTRKRERCFAGLHNGGQPTRSCKRWLRSTVRATHLTERQPDKPIQAHVRAWAVRLIIGARQPSAHSGSNSPRRVRTYNIRRFSHTTTRAHATQFPTLSKGRASSLLCTTLCAARSTAKIRFSYSTRYYPLRFGH